MVAAWDAEFAKAQPPQRLIMLYLANDILQNSRRKVGFTHNVGPCMILPGGGFHVYTVPAPCNGALLVRHCCNAEAACLASPPD